MINQGGLKWMKRSGFWAVLDHVCGKASLSDGVRLLGPPEAKIQ